MSRITKGIIGRPNRLLTLALAATFLPLISACGTSTDTGTGAGSASSPTTMSNPTAISNPTAMSNPTSMSGGAGGTKPTVKVGSKDFTEQLIVNEMAAALLEDAGYPVQRKLNLGGSAVVHQAVVSGDVDMYVEYTGTGLTAILKLPVQTDPQKVFDTVKQGYETQFKSTWLKPWGFNDTYALAMRQDQATQLGIKSISDLKSKADTLTLGATQEFITRPDGLPGLQTTYGVKFKDSKGMDPGIMYQAVDSKQVDVISGFSTDGRIPAQNLTVLADDKQFFPPYFAAPVVRQDLLAKDPAIADVLNKMSGKLDDKTMASLNLQVDKDKKEPGDVAKSWLKQQGLIK